MADEKIDYGVWNLPKGWDELTLKQFQQIDEYYADKDKEFDVRDVLEVFTDHSRDEVDQLPIEFVESLLEALKWLSEPPQMDEPTHKIKVNGEEYHINFQNKLKTGEFIAVQTLLKGDKYNYAAMLAILCRKEGEVYDSKFENEVLEDRIAMFEKIPMLDAMRVVNFFLSLWLISQNHTQLYSQVEEALNLTQSRIETLQKSGELSKLSTRLLMRKLRKLRKSIKYI